METITLKKGQSLESEQSENLVLKTIYERRAIRKYKEEQVPANLLAKILDAGRMAPSAINKQPWVFYVLKNKMEIQHFSKEISKCVLIEVVNSGFKGILKAGREFLNFAHGTNFLQVDDPVFHNAPTVVFLCAPKDNEWAALDLGMCAQNMMLAAKSFGIDSCPIGMAKFVEYSKIYGQLQVPKSEKVHLAIVFGYGAETAVAKERNKSNAVFL
jgi:nitroreductase